MKHNKRLISVILVISVMLSVFTLSLFNAFAKTQQLILNTKMTGIIDGVDDLAWFTYTPQESGTFSFMSFNDYASEGYLFIKEVDPETNTKAYKQLAYATNDPNYESNGHNFRQFCLTYHLEKGVRYYFAAGFVLSENRTDGNMTVMLRCDGYDNDIAYVTAECSAELEAYEDGEYKTDSAGNSYFFYDISKVISNTKVTIHYNDNTTVTGNGGASEIDGYSVSYNHNQDEKHWYPQDSNLYSGNTLTVGVLGKTYDIDVKIISSGRYCVKGVVVDTMGSPVADANVVNEVNDIVAKTDQNGAFSFYLTTGRKDFTINADNAVSRKIVIYVSVKESENDYSKAPIELCCYDCNKDEIVNAKDFAIINKSISPGEDNGIRTDFAKYINFTAQDYSEMILTNN